MAERDILESLFLMRTGPFMEAVRTKDWKYVRYFRSDTSQYTAKDVDFTGREPDSSSCSIWSTIPQRSAT